MKETYNLNRRFKDDMRMLTYPYRIYNHPISISTNHHSIAKPSISPICKHPSLYSASTHLFNLQTPTFLLCNDPSFQSPSTHPSELQTPIFPLCNDPSLQSPSTHHSNLQTTLFSLCNDPSLKSSTTLLSNLQPPI